MQGVSDAEAAAPVVARETPLGRLWYRPDKAFQTPKAVVYLDIESPASYSSPESSVLTRIFTKLLNDSLNELAYPADLAGAPGKPRRGQSTECSGHPRGSSRRTAPGLFSSKNVFLLVKGMNMLVFSPFGRRSRLS